MPYTQEELKSLLTLEEFPRSAKYDPQWIIDNMMGPNVVWLAESLTQVMALEPGMRVLDMGCGKALSSIFLAREFDLQVWATDLWLSASSNWERILEAGAENEVFPIHAEAHALPYADGFFDALVSLDAYHYFGTDDLYINRFARLLKPGGQLGIVVPGLVQELGQRVPEHMAACWEWDFCSFHSPDWWRDHWMKTGKVDVVHADLVPDGWRHWLKWDEVVLQHLPGDQHDNKAVDDEAFMEMLRTDAGRNLGFSRVVAQKL